MRSCGTRHIFSSPDPAFAFYQPSGRNSILMRQEFINAVNEHQTAFGLNLADDGIERLADYYEVIQEYNPILHLVGPCTAEEFAIRHILESLTLLEYLPVNAKFADVGTGAGLPSLPCLLARNDLKGVLIESKIKKARFLESAVERLGLACRVQIINRQFEETDPGNCQFVTCRALDKFTGKLPALYKWSKRRFMLLFGGNKLGEALLKQGVKFDQELMPMSEQRFLFLTTG